MENRYLRDQASVFLRVPTSEIRKVRMDERRQEVVVIYGPTLVKRRVALSDLANIQTGPKKKEPEPPEVTFTVPTVDELRALSAEQLDEFKRDELAQIAEAHGVEIESRARKADIIAALQLELQPETPESTSDPVTPE